MINKKFWITFLSPSLLFLSASSCEEKILKPVKSNNPSSNLSIKDLDLQEMVDFVASFAGPMIVMSGSGSDFSGVNGDETKQALTTYFYKYDHIENKNFKYIDLSKLDSNQLKRISEEDMKCQVLHYIKELKKLIALGLIYKNASVGSLDSSNVHLITGWKPVLADLPFIRDINNLVTKKYDSWKKVYYS